MSANSNEQKNWFGYPEGCGWWCRRGVDLANAAINYVLGGPIGATLSIIESSISGKITFSKLPPTLFEEEILNNWYSEYESFYKTLLERTDKYVSLQTFDKSNLIEINEVFQQMELMINYWANEADKDLLRQQIFTDRQQFMITYFDIIKENLKSYVTRVKPSLKIKQVDFNYTTLSPGVPFELVGTYKVTLFYDKELASDITDIIPIDPIDPKGNNGTGTGTGTNTGTDTGTDTGNTNATLGNKSYISWIVGAIVAYRIFK